MRFEDGSLKYDPFIFVFCLFKLSTLVEVIGSLLTMYSEMYCVSEEFLSFDVMFRFEHFTICLSDVFLLVSFAIFVIDFGLFKVFML